MCIPIIASQRLGKDITAATNTQATIEKLSFSMWIVMYQREVGD
jgi:hypothetical protein